jgi:hypothetical protein
MINTLNKNKHQAAVVTAVQVVEPLVLTYIRSFVVDPSLRKYKLPLAALNVGTPDPKNMPKLAVLENL